VRKGTSIEKVEQRFGGRPLAQILWELENRHVPRKLTVKEIAEQLGVPLITLYIWRRNYGISRRNRG